jgi:hypothetical protein
MSEKIWIKELSTNREHQCDLDLRVARAPKDFDERKKGAGVVRDEGSIVHMQTPDTKFRLQTTELKETKVGERIFAKAGSSKVGSTFWPLFEVMSGPQPEKK